MVLYINQYFKNPPGIFGSLFGFLKHTPYNTGIISRQFLSAIF